MKGIGWEKMVDRELLLELCEQMLKVSLSEQKHLRLIDEGKVSGFCHARAAGCARWGLRRGRTISLDPCA